VQVNSPDGISILGIYSTLTPNRKSHIRRDAVGLRFSSTSLPQRAPSTAATNPILSKTNAHASRNAPRPQTTLRKPFSPPPPTPSTSFPSTPHYNQLTPPPPGRSNPGGLLLGRSDPTPRSPPPSPGVLLSGRLLRSRECRGHADPRGPREPRADGEEDGEAGAGVRV
jgi:hypothetical protein